MVEVSIIVPVYNVEKYVEECLDSICNQTFEDIEIICINDGSTDGSLEILERYADKDSRISITSQKNSGLSATRNVGLRLCKGKYIYFMDSDDILELDAIERLHTLSEENSLDMIIFKLLSFYDETGERFENKYYDMSYLKGLTPDNIFSYNEIRQNIYKISANVQAKFYRSDLIGDMEFEEGLIFEDNPFTVESIFKAERIMYLEESLCLKRVRKTSITASHNRDFVDVIPIANRIIDLTRHYGHYDELKVPLINKKFRRIFVRYEDIDDEYKDYFYEKIREDFKDRREEYAEVMEDNSKMHDYVNKIIDCESRSEFELFDELHKVNIENRKLKRKYKAIKKYNTARIQFKNIGSSTNSIEIIESSDDDLGIKVPQNLCDENGKAVVIHSDVNSLDLKLRAIGDGLLTIDFKSYNINLENGERFLIYIDYTDITINGRNYITERTMVNFVEPFTIEKRVADSDILDIHVEWESVSGNTPYINKYRALKKEYTPMKKDYEHVKKVNKMLYKQLGVMRSSTSWKVTKPIRVVGDFAKGNKK
ncbi:MAG: glycosyltransferase [Methanobrevibacter sp.]|nr:glycosyltransferase [Methanobrevibacter sp.]